MPRRTPVRHPAPPRAAGSRRAAEASLATLPLTARFLAALLLTAASGPGALWAQVTPPSVTAVRADPGSADEGSPIHLTASVDHSTGGELTYTWDPGDGSAPRSGAGLTSVVHRYSDNGTFTFTVTVDAGTGSVAEGTGTVSIQNVPPEITALAAPSEAARDEPVELQAVARDPGADDVLTYHWDFGDGETASGTDLPRTTHRFAEPGVHTVRLTVEDDDGGRTSRTVLVPVERTFDFELAGAVNGSITGGFDPRPGFMAIPPGSPSEIPAGTCQLAVTMYGDDDDMVLLGGLLQTPIRPGSYEAYLGTDQRPGTFKVQDMLRCDRPEVDCSGGLWRGQAVSGAVELTETSADLVEGRIDVTMGFSEESYRLSGAFTAPPTTVFGFPVSRGAGTCFTTGVMAVESLAPGPDAQNVDADSAEVRVALTEPYDPGSLDDGTFRLEYRLPDDRGGGAVATEAYQPVDGVLETTSERTFRFVPSAPLLDGVFYRATIAGGEGGLRGAGGERMEDDRSWRFSTMVEPEAIRVAVFQVARNAPLVPGKTTLTRVYVDWQEKDEVHPDWQVVTFPARVEVEVDGGPVGAYPAREPATLRRPDEFSVDDSAQARNSVNFFGWEPTGTGGTSVVSAIVEPTGQEVSPPRRFESAPLRLEHHSASPRLSIEAQHLLVGPWEESVPDEARSQTGDILREGTTFTVQNFPVVDIRSTTAGDLPVDEPFMLSWTQDRGLETYRDLFDAVRRDEYLAKQAHDMVAPDTDADLLLLFIPGEIQPGVGGYSYDFPLRTVGIMIAPSAGPQSVSKATSSVAHEIGHAFGLSHASSCPEGQFQACLKGGKEDSDEIEGFRLALDGSGGQNKSKSEGNAEAPITQAVLSLMHPDAIGDPGLFILNEQYQDLMSHPRLASATAFPWWAPGASGASPTLTASLASGPLGTPPQAARFFLISGLILPAGSGPRALLDPVRVVEGDPRVADVPGPYTVEVLAGNGSVLSTSSFAPVPVTAGHVTDTTGVLTESVPAGGEEGGWFWVAAPYAEDAQAIVVRDGGGTLMRLDRSPEPPTVELEATGAGTDAIELRWSGSDADGDPVAYTLSYSPDGETGWRSLSRPWTRAVSMSVDASLLRAGPRPTIRIVATDGFNRSEASVQLTGGSPW